MGKSRRWEAKPCLPCPSSSWPARGFLGPERQVSSPQRQLTGHLTGCNHRLRLLQRGPSMLKPRGQVGLCPCMQWGTLGDSPPSPAQVWVGCSPALPTVPALPGPPRVWVSSAQGVAKRWRRLSVEGRDLELVSPGPGGGWRQAMLPGKLMRSPEGSVSGLTQLSGHPSCREQLIKRECE